MNKKPSGLGRGLGSLIPQRPTEEGASSATPVKTVERPVSDGQPLQLPLAKIQVNPEQPRLEFRHQELEELTESIREHGILQPLTVTPLSGGNFELIAGERRFRAAKLLGLASVPVFVRPTSDAGNKLVLALIENIQRQDLNPMEEAKGYERLSREFAMTQEDIARQVGKARSTVANLMRLLELPQVIQDAVAEGRVPAGTARAILALKDDQSRLAFFNKLMAEKATTRDAEAGARGGDVKRHHRDPAVAAAEDQIRQALGAKVEIKKQEGRGSITIAFHSDDEFTDLVSRLIE